MSTKFKEINLMVGDNMVFCRPHRRETCPECDLDFSSLNSLHKSLLEINGNIPPPNAVDEGLIREVLRIREEGNKHFKAQNYHEAIKLYTMAIELAFKRPVWEPHEITARDVSLCLSNRSAAYMGINSWVNAYVDAEWGISIRPEYVKGYFRKGKALMAMGRYEEAIMAFESGLELSPKDKSLEDLLNEAIKLRGKD
ncbi:17532_t:CDS:1 [Acaulospora morrowiae]|uniref:17532_t:CDS:1 n=1 Tax=Acaulospora morrowiae TaxID=94023 RepID=A0A9N9AFS6_9GLOM|nr:17532_t:CDS:1 [Acaulospora morrowiae]